MGFTPVEKTSAATTAGRPPAAGRMPAKRDAKVNEEARRKLWEAEQLAKKESTEGGAGPDEATMELMRAAAEKLAKSGGDSDAELSALEALGVGGVQLDKMLAAGFRSLRALASNKAVFQLRQWEKGMLEEVGKEWANHPQWTAIRRMLAHRTGLVPVSEKSQDSPWSAYSHETMVRMEEEMLALAGREDGDGWGIPDALVEEVIALSETMAEEQKVAVRTSCRGARAVVVTEGTAGAGKSFSLKSVRQIYERAPAAGGEPEGYAILGTALSWSAALVLKASADLPDSMAIDKLLSEINKSEEKGQAFFKKRTLLIVDEAGLVGTEKMLTLMRKAKESKHKVRIVLTGDSLQLDPVEAGNALEAIVEQYGSARLDTIRRQELASHRAAVKHFCFGRAHHGLWTYLQQEAITFCENAGERFERVVADYKAYALANPTKTALALANTNEDVRHLNTAIREAMKKEGRVVPPEFKVRVTDGRQTFESMFAVGDQIVFRKNMAKQPIYKSNFKKMCEAFSPEARKKAGKGKGGLFGAVMSSLGFGFKQDEIERHGVFNRMGGVILSIKESRSRKGSYDIRVLLSEGGEVLVNTADLWNEDKKACAFHHNFATTVYASQGQTVERVFMLDSERMSRRLAYVGMSRHTEHCDIYVDKEEVESRIAKSIDRARDGAWKKFARERKRAEKIAEENRKQMAARDVMSKDPGSAKSKHESAVQLKGDLIKLDDETRRMLRPSDYLRAMSEAWSKDQANLTVFIARKHLEEKLAVKSEDRFFPSRAPEDNPDDYLIPPQDLEKKTSYIYERPPGFGGVEPDSDSAAKDDAPREERGFFKNLFGHGEDTPSAPTTEAAGPPESRLAAMDGITDALLAKTKGELWNINRFGEERVIAWDIHEEPVSRYTPEGVLTAGDGQIPVFPNVEAHHERRACPFMLVRGVREGMLCWDFFRRKYASEREKIPHVAIGMDGADWNTLAPWAENFKRDARVYVAWSPKDPSSILWALEARDRMRNLGWATGFYPKAPPGGLESLVENQQKQAVKNGM